MIGGSFNDSASADSRNDENVTFIDSPDVAGWFLANWQSRRDVSGPGGESNGTAAWPLHADLRQVGIGGGIVPEALVLVPDEGSDSDLAPAAVTK